jgi:hypothetical protein
MCFIYNFHNKYNIAAFWIRAKISGNTYCLINSSCLHDYFLGSLSSCVPGIYNRTDKVECLWSELLPGFLLTCINCCSMYLPQLWEVSSPDNLFISNLTCLSFILLLKGLRYGLVNSVQSDHSLRKTTYKQTFFSWLMTILLWKPPMWLPV